MSNIRMPVSGDHFSHLVKGAPDEDRDLAHFPTYAHLIAAAAGVGRALGEFEEEIEFKEREPRPIPMETFKSQGLYNSLLIFAMVQARDARVCQDEDRLCRTIESLASAGFRAMQKLYDEAGAQYWVESWSDFVLRAAARGFSPGNGAVELSPANEIPNRTHGQKV